VVFNIAKVYFENCIFEPDPEISYAYKKSIQTLKKRRWKAGKDQKVTKR